MVEEEAEYRRNGTIQRDDSPLRLYLTVHTWLNLLP
jgi:hypothetical protein